MPNDTSILAGNTLLAFATPVVSYAWPDTDAMNTALAKEIRRRAASERGIVRANAGGWHSALDLLNWQADGIAAFQKNLSTMAQELAKVSIAEEQHPNQQKVRLAAWANLSGKSDYHELHDHPGAHWSGVYYVKDVPTDPEHPSAGRLELLDPRLGVNMVPLAGSRLNQRMLFQPQAGLMICFPSWLKHFVHPMRQEAERISISFNMRFEPA